MKKKKLSTVANTAADPTVEYLPVTLCGREVKLAFDFNALAVAEAEAGINLLAGVKGVLSQELTISQLRALLFAAMLKAQPETTLEEAGSLITITNHQVVFSAIVSAFVLSMPPEERERKNAEAPADSTPAA